MRCSDRELHSVVAHDRGRGQSWFVRGKISYCLPLTLRLEVRCYGILDYIGHHTSCDTLRGTTTAYVMMFVLARITVLFPLMAALDVMDKTSDKILSTGEHGQLVVKKRTDTATKLARYAEKFDSEAQVQMMEVTGALYSKVYDERFSI